ncbi:MAG: hypothetical protein WC373_01915 [Smithella sp.]|jgi:hypothetical protein
MNISTSMTTSIATNMNTNTSMTVKNTRTAIFTNTNMSMNMNTNTRIHTAAAKKRIITPMKASTGSMTIFILLMIMRSIITSTDCRGYQR